MENGIRKIRYAVMLAMASILCIFMACIVVRILTKNIVVEKLNINNNITQFILTGVETSDVIDEATGDTFESIDWEELYPFETEEELEDDIDADNVVAKTSFADNYKNKLSHVTSVLTQYCSDFLMNRTWFVEKAYAYDASIGWTLMPSDEADGVVVLENGYLSQLHGKEDVSAITDNAVSFNNFLEEQDIDFLYVQAPVKISQTDTQLPAGMEDYANENADTFIGNLNDNGIDTLDLRPYMYDISSDYYGAFYKTDHHWTTTTAFKMAGVLADYLNKNYDFDFDEKYYDINNYTVEHYENYFLGSLGKKITLAMTEPEDYDLIVPNFNMNFRIQIPERDIDLEGDFKDTLLDYRHLENIDYYNENCYASFMNRNDATGIIHNLESTCNQGKRILFIKDSYSTPLIPYIALGTEYVNTLYEVRFTGSVRSYVESIKPDIVIVMYTASNVSGDGSGKTTVLNLE
jgi:hypothetical protein